MNGIHVDIIESFKDIPLIKSVMINPTVHVTAYLDVSLENKDSNLDILVIKKKKDLMKKYPYMILDVKYRIKN